METMKLEPMVRCNIAQLSQTMPRKAGQELPRLQSRKVEDSRTKNKCQERLHAPLPKRALLDIQIPQKCPIMQALLVNQSCRRTRTLSRAKGTTGNVPKVEPMVRHHQRGTIHPAWRTQTLAMEKGLEKQRPTLSILKGPTAMSPDPASVLLGLRLTRRILNL
ncbi:unnamed protein product [Boreogadus saida]